MQIRLLIASILTMISGGFIYILLRSSSIKFFSWYESFGLNNSLINTLREYTLKTSNIIPNWFIFSLPDGLWIFSYICMMLYIWQCQISKRNIFWILIVPLLILLSEFAQFFGLLIGTFDFMDVIFLILGAILPFIIFNPLINFKRL